MFISSNLALDMLFFVAVAGYGIYAGVGWLVDRGRSQRGSAREGEGR